MKENVQILTVQDVGDSFDVELNWGHIRTIKSLTYILRVPFHRPIKQDRLPAARNHHIRLGKHI